MNEKAPSYIVPVGFWIRHNALVYIHADLGTHWFVQISSTWVFQCAPKGEVGLTP